MALHPIWTHHLTEDPNLLTLPNPSKYITAEDVKTFVETSPALLNIKQVKPFLYDTCLLDVQKLLAISEILSKNGNLLLGYVTAHDTDIGSRLTSLMRNRKWMAATDLTITNIGTEYNLSDFPEEVLKTKIITHTCSNTKLCFIHYYQNHYVVFIHGSVYFGDDRMLDCYKKYVMWLFDCTHIHPDLEHERVNYLNEKMLNLKDCKVSYLFDLPRNPNMNGEEVGDFGYNEIGVHVADCIDADKLPQVPEGVKRITNVRYIKYKDHEYYIGYTEKGYLLFTNTAYRLDVFMENIKDLNESGCKLKMINFTQYRCMRVISEETQTLKDLFDLRNPDLRYNIPNLFNRTRRLFIHLSLSDIGVSGETGYTTVYKRENKHGVDYIVVGNDSRTVRIVSQYLREVLEYKL